MYLFSVGHSDRYQNESEEGIGCCGCILMGISYFLVGIFLPFSLCLTIKV